MRTSLKACALFAVAALVALQSAQPVSAALVDRDLFENITPSLYAQLDRRQDGGQTAVPTTTSTSVNPTATVGAQCRSPADCNSGHCSRSKGRCLPAPGDGETNDFCTRDSQCEGYCYRGSCQPIKANDSPCYKDSGCQSGNCYKKRCKPLAMTPQGSRCTQSVQCQEGLFCNRSRCDTIKGPGSYCYKNQACDSGICNNDRCTTKGTRRVGQTCQRNTQCASAHCWKGACRARRARGQPCSANQTCLSSRCINATCE